MAVRYASHTEYPVIAIAGPINVTIPDPITIPTAIAKRSPRSSIPGFGSGVFTIKFLLLIFLSPLFFTLIIYFLLFINDIVSIIKL